MPASPAASIPPLSPGEMQLLLSRAGLALNPGQVADLVLAWRQVAGLIASMKHDRPLADDMAIAFRLAPPALAGAKAADLIAGAPKVPAKRARQAVKPKAKARAKTQAKAKAAPKRADSRLVGSKTAKRRR